MPPPIETQLPLSPEWAANEGEQEGWANRSHPRNLLPVNSKTVALQKAWFVVGLQLNWPMSISKT